MKQLIEKGYHRLPVFLQNFAVSLYGLRINKIRHGLYFGEFGRHIAANLDASAKELAVYQLEALKSLLHQCTHVPYYRRLFAREGIQPSKIRELTDIRKIPLLEKNVLRMDPESLVSDLYTLKELNIIHTTGTTGTPLQIYCNPQVRQRNYAFYQRYLHQANIPYEGRKATFGGKVVVRYDQIEPPFWRYSRFQKNLLFSSFHLRDENMSAYINALRDIQPDYIEAYPSSLFPLATYARKHKLSLAGITKAIVTSAETLSSAQREVIEDVFATRIYDQYGATEMCIFIGQCSSGSYHLHNDYSLVEFLRNDGSYASPGEEARVVCTGFINHVMPLVRYCLGDRVVVGENQCDCGSFFPVIEKIVGRDDDVIITPDGCRIGRLGSVLKGFPIREAQYCQAHVDKVDVYIVKDSGYSESTERRVRSELMKRLGNKIQIQLLYCKEIQRGHGGKLKSIVSTLNKFD